MITELLKKIEFKKILIFNLLFKIILLPIYSHPFDFVSYWYRYAQYYVYDISLFRNFNKGIFEILYEFPGYSLFVFIQNFFKVNINESILLHFIFKIPYVFADFLILYFIVKIWEISKIKLIDKKFIALLWIFSPLPFLGYVFHAGIEVMVALGIVMAIYGALSKKWFYTALGIVISVQMKYFPLIYVPFIYIYLLRAENAKKLLKKITLTIFIFLAISFFHLIDKDNFTYLITSLWDHSGISEAVVSQRISTINIFGAFNYLFSDIGLTQNNYPLLYSFVKNYSYLFFLVIFFTMITFRSITYKKYGEENFIYDLLLITTTFFVFSNNFQRHYLLYVGLLLILLTIYSKRVINIVFIYSVFSTIAILKSENGIATNLLNIFKPIHLPGLENQGMFITEFINLCLLLSMFCGLFYDKLSEKITNSFNFYILSWLLIFVPTIYVLFYSFIDTSIYKPDYDYRKNLKQGNIFFEIPFERSTDKLFIVTPQQQYIGYLSDIDNYRKENFVNMYIKNNSKSCFNPTYLYINGCKYKFTYLEKNYLTENLKCINLDKKNIVYIEESTNLESNKATLVIETNNSNVYSNKKDQVLFLGLFLSIILYLTIIYLLIRVIKYVK